MSNGHIEHKPKIYRAEDIKYHGDEPYLEIILGQMVIQLLLKNVGSNQEPIWIAWFDPLEEKIKMAGSQALVEILDKLTNVSLAITPFSSKSIPMIVKACEKIELPLLDLVGSTDFDHIKAQTCQEDLIYAYFPITSQDKAKYLAFGEETVKHIQRVIRSGQGIVIIDDVYSSGATIKAILDGLKDILGEELFKIADIEVVTVAREGILRNGEPVPEIDMEKNLTYAVFIPEIIGDL
ncbi:MAG: hypothetical protein GW941_00905 [Candidatus Pacebacteria bacterium]|nr:hypothetical protein [Candidatus Paceibacterota bacterium]